VKESLKRLVQLYEATGQSEKAAEWKQKLAEFEQAQKQRPTGAILPQPNPRNAGEPLGISQIPLFHGGRLV
jgi:hypothetical protein